MSVIADIR